MIEKFFGWVNKVGNNFYFFCFFDLYGLIVKEICWLWKIDLYCRFLEELENKVNVVRISSIGVIEF